MITLSELLYFSLLVDSADDATKEDCVEAARRALSIEAVFKEEKNKFSPSDTVLDLDNAITFDSTKKSTKPPVKQRSMEGDREPVTIYLDPRLKEHGPTLIFTDRGYRIFNPKLEGPDEPELMAYYHPNEHGFFNTNESDPHFKDHLSFTKLHHSSFFIASRRPSIPVKPT